MRASYDVMYEALPSGSSTGAAWTTRWSRPTRGRSAAASTTSSWRRARSARTCSSTARTATTWPTWRPPGRRPPEPRADGPRAARPRSTRPDAPTIERWRSCWTRRRRGRSRCILFDVAGRDGRRSWCPATARSTRQARAAASSPRRSAVRRRRTSRARGFVKGYVGPQGFARTSRSSPTTPCAAARDWVTGANRPDHHVTGANVGRDFRVDRWEDLVEFREGDRCPIDGGELRIARSIVLGPHLPAGDEVLGAARGHVRGRGRRRRSRT